MSGQHVAVVTGGSSGIGRAIVDHLIDKRWVVLNIDRVKPQHTTGSFPTFEPSPAISCGQMSEQR